MNNCKVCNKLTYFNNFCSAQCEIKWIKDNLGYDTTIDELKEIYEK